MKARGRRTIGRNRGSDQSDAPEIVVAIYTNRHGDVETRAFRNASAARAWKDEIARMNWNAARDGAAPEAIGDAWFELQGDRGDESFSVERCRLR